jgi:hypothetical protein
MWVAISGVLGFVTECEAHVSDVEGVDTQFKSHGRQYVSKRAVPDFCKNI